VGADARSGARGGTPLADDAPSFLKARPRAPQRWRTGAAA